MKYKQALDYIYSFTDYEKLKGYHYTPQDFNLNRVEQLLTLLGNPHKAFPSVHIAGTKGKGSTAAMIESILRAAGYRTGLYISPHLHTFRERIRIGGELISEEDVVAGIESIRPMAEKTPGLTTFEIITSLAFHLFAREQVDIAVVEVGLGGRLDATNVITPLAAVITSLSFDHTYLLGNTLASIAKEKAGIIKEGIPVVSAPQKPEALAVIEEVCQEKGAPLVLVGRDWSWRVLTINLEGQEFEVLRDSIVIYRRLWIPLLGRHQFINATVAVACINELCNQGLGIPDKAVKEGLRQVRWPGRLEILQKRPFFVVDGAHNVDSANRLAEALQELFTWRRCILIFGASSDKDIPGMLRELLPLADEVLFASAHHPRATPPEKLAEEAKGLGYQSISVGNVREAVQKALAEAGPEDLICATGSLFLVAEAREAWAALTGHRMPQKDPL
ncbi:MAG: bifunctional folylpolyglutamate synthase/dihydrofolate synthase [Chloroflexi bacterium]|nr:MAG: bifunctional folylpolyglutamate synthase/dihydrofolate synthase [Chloroflexota bacterium]